MYSSQKLKRFNHKECTVALAEALCSFYTLIMHKQSPEHRIKGGQARLSYRVHQSQSLGEEQHQEEQEQEEIQTKLRPEEDYYAECK